jgi:hypothetical protein
MFNIEMPRTKSSAIAVVSRPSAPPSVQHFHSHNVERPGFFSNMWQGFGLGAGQAIAHNWFRNDPVVKHVHEVMPKEYEQCMKDNQGDKDLCKQFLTKN